MGQRPLEICHGHPVLLASSPHMIGGGALLVSNLNQGYRIPSQDTTRYIQGILLLHAGMYQDPCACRCSEPDTPQKGTNIRLPTRLPALQSALQRKSRNTRSEQSLSNFLHDDFVQNRLQTAIVSRIDSGNGS